MLEVEGLKDPFLIGLYSGCVKPVSVDEYLSDFVEEVQVLEQLGVSIGEKKFDFRISAVICDAPARSFVKKVKNFNSYHGCERCTQPGVWNGKITYPENDAARRTDTTFANQSDEDHHRGISPLAGTSVKLVTEFPLDYMHLCCLGVMRKLIYFWMKGPLKVRLGVQAVKSVSAYLNEYKTFIPTEFARKPRCLEEIDRWKATELRQFLLYTGPVALCRNLPAVFYKNFLLFHVGMVIFLGPDSDRATYEYAGDIIKAFVQHYTELYGKDAVVYNVHNLIHLVDDAKHYGSLNNVSAFQFENFLGSLKKLIRKPHLPLQQVVRRVSEGIIRHKSPNILQNYILKYEHHFGPVTENLKFFVQYKVLVLPNMILKITRGDNCLLLNDTICVIRNILAKNEKLYILVSKFEKKEDFFIYPVHSSRLDIYRVSNLSITLQAVPITKSSSLKKCVLLPYGNEIFISFPVLHCSVIK